MSYPTKDDINYTYEPPPNICNLCYPANQTPHRKYLCLSGIQIGALWNPGDKPAPNGIYSIDAVGVCGWSTVHGDLTPSYSTTAMFSQIIMDSAVSGRMFFNPVGAPCDSLLPNAFQNPAITKYYDGWAIVLNTKPEGLYPFLEVMEAIVLEPHEETWGDTWGISPTRAVHRFVRDFDKTNIKVLYDYA